MRLICLCSSGAIIAIWSLAVPAYAFERPGFAPCIQNPKICLGELPKGFSDDVVDLPVVPVEELQKKKVMFGTNRSVKSFKKSNNLSVISDMFSSDYSNYITTGYIVSEVLPNNNHNIDSKILSLDIDVVFFNEDKSLDEFIKSEIKNSHFLYVHGANNNFGSAINSALLMSDAARMDITPIVFSWPTMQWWQWRRMIPIRNPYNHDVTTSGQSVAQFERFIGRILSGGIDKLDIFAHSLGAQVVTRTLSTYILKQDYEPRIRSVTYAAPDMDNIEFYNAYEEIFKNSDIKVTVYAHEEDLALYLSEFWNYHERVRSSGISAIGGHFEFINVGQSGDILGHDFPTSNRRVSMDYREFLLSGKQAAERSALLRTGDYQYILQEDE
jgi:pimeloyl-ACP methyl ester carboxylesterase